MKKRLYLILLPLLLSGCYLNNRLFHDPAILDTTIPGRITNGPLDVYFPGESGPGKPYRKLAFLDSQYSDATLRLNELRKKARTYGSDGLIILSSTNELKLQANLVTETEGSDEEVESTGYISSSPSMQAVAIVYEENLSPRSFNQYANVYRYTDGSDNDELIIRKEYDYYQNVIDIRKIADKKLPYELVLYPKRTSIQFLLYNTENWVQSNIDSDYRKQVDKDGKWVRQVRMVRNEAGYLNKIVVKEQNTYPGQRYEIYELRVNYDRLGRIDKSEFYRIKGSRKELLEIHHYTYDGKRLAEELILREEGNKMKSWLRIEYVPFPENYTLEQAMN
ncbi:MAG: hypothetical protein WBB45_09740 [Cyclobacteriaceae bacterium]